MIDPNDKLLNGRTMEAKRHDDDDDEADYDYDEDDEYYEE